MDWSSFASEVAPFIVKIRTQFQYGTGFIFWQNTDHCCIATANHVISPANQEGWEQPIYITQPNGQELRLNPEHRRINPNLNEGDSAAILINKGGLDLPSECLPLWNSSMRVPIGTEVGWLGYPVIIDEHSFLQPSFFSGIISNVFPKFEQYTIDGVAINGVSGGPVFCKLNETGPHVIGTISSYFANRVPISGGTEAWPGLAISHSFSVFEPVISELKDFDDAMQSNLQYNQTEAPA